MNTRNSEIPAQPWAMSVEEAARMIGVGRTSIYAAIASGALKARKFGSRTLILAEDAKSFLSALSEVSAA